MPPDLPARLRQPGMEFTADIPSDLRDRTDIQVAVLSNFRERAWTVTGCVEALDDDGLLVWVRGWNEGNAFRMPVAKNLPAWFLQVGVAFEADLPWSMAMADRSEERAVPVHALSNFRELPYADKNH